MKKKILYAPWRDKYTTRDKTAISSCVFCNIIQNPDTTDMEIIYKDKNFFIVMNKYPYTPGHIMVIPKIHTDKLEILDSKVWLEMSLIAQKCVPLFTEELGAKGINIGMNIGAAAGAGIAEHLHLHIIPRWYHDDNLPYALQYTNINKNDFDKIYNKIKELLHTYTSL